MCENNDCKNIGEFVPKSLSFGDKNNLTKDTQLSVNQSKNKRK